MKLTALLPYFLLLAAACGKNDAENFADSYCAEVAKCCTQAGISSNGQVCHMLFSGGSYNATAGQACLNEMNAKVAAGTFCSDNGTSTTCNQVYSTGASGSKKPGDTCEQDSDCASSAKGKVTCASLYTGSENWIYKCQVQIAGKAGDGPCLGTQDGDIFSSFSTSTVLPSEGYVCNTADGVQCATGTCVALSAVGQSCDYSSNCVRDAFCDSNSHCTSRAAAGATCKGVDSDECTSGYYCPTASSRQCTAKAANGSACTSDSMCKSDTCNTGTCQAGALEAFGWSIVCS